MAPEEATAEQPSQPHRPPRPCGRLCPKALQEVSPCASQSNGGRRKGGPSEWSELEVNSAVAKVWLPSTAHAGIGPRLEQTNVLSRSRDRALTAWLTNVRQQFSTYSDKSANACAVSRGNDRWSTGHRAFCVEVPLQDLSCQSNCGRCKGGQHGLKLNWL